MCGIAGLVDFAAGADAQLVADMCDRLVHRGPDARGIHAAADAVLGSQRLAIIDVVGGEQPLFSEDGQVAAVVNGEIYNFVELRERLLARGHDFATGSDAEVVIHLYEDHGDELVHHLRGMFAFALWDARRRRLLVARDRVGKKPLFYAAQGARIAFASEMRALLADPELDTTIDLRALDAYLALQYVPHPFSIFESVRKLPPGSLLTFDSQGVGVARYWRLQYEPKTDELDEAEAAERLRAELDEATRIRLMSEVPLGAFLSGGVDSSAVVASMARQSAAPVKTFSITFGEADFDEARYARIVADRYSTDHHEFKVEPHAIGILPRLARHYGEPYADPSAIPSFHLAELAGHHVTVALNGDGGDEAFAGYGRYRRMETLRRLRLAAHPVRGVVAALGERVARGGADTRMRRRLAYAGLMLTADEPRVYEDSIQIFGPERRRALLTPEVREGLGGWRAESVLDEVWASRDAHGVDRLLAVDVETYLPGDLLVKMDTATMAHSLEARSPFLDHKLLEFAARLPADLKFRRGAGKRILKRAMRGIVPDEILDRPKMGFGVPLKHWFRGELRELPRTLLLDPSAHCRRYLVGSEIERLLSEHDDGVYDHAPRIWSLIQLEVWHQEVLEQRRTPVPRS
jgi:asparagine synthase (glutamine-hydrolysing)